MTDREERQHVIEVLRSWDGYFIGYTSDEVQEALRYAISSIETDLKYDLLHEETSEQKEPTTEACETCRYYGSHHGVCDYCYKCSLWTEKEPNKSEISAGSTTKNDDLALIRTWGLDEEIRCTMCTNSMKSDRGCDGSCVVNKDMYKAVMDAIEKRIQSTTKNDCETCIHNKGVLECDMYGCKYEPTTKNDLVVDWDSYKDVDGNSLDDLILEVLQNNFDCGNTYGYKVADEIIGLLPPATPQEPRKGHWVLTDVEGDKVWHCNCSECGKDPQDYVGGSENWWLIKSKLPKFCPNCGSDNREVKE